MIRYIVTKPFDIDLETKIPVNTILMLIDNKLFLDGAWICDKESCYGKNNTKVYSENNNLRETV